MNQAHLVEYDHIRLPQLRQNRATRWSWPIKTPERDLRSMADCIIRNGSMGVTKKPGRISRRILEDVLFTRVFAGTQIDTHWLHRVDSTVRENEGRTETGDELATARGQSVSMKVAQALEEIGDFTIAPT